MTFLVEFGWVGVGVCHGLFPGVRMGLVQIMVVRGGITAWARESEAALKRARDALMGVRGRG